MIPLSLRQFASAVGADPKWVLNAAARMGRPFDYTAADAQWLRLARSLNRELRIPLRTAGALARAATQAGPAPVPHAGAQADAPPPTPVVQLLHLTAEGLSLTVDLERHRTTFAAALAAAIAFETPRRPGRKRPAPRNFGAALVRARHNGIKVGLLRARLRRPSAARLAQPQTPAQTPARETGAPDIARILSCLESNGVRTVVAGDVAEAIHGAGPLDGLDPVPLLEPLELCYESTPTNLARLATALRDLGARPRHDTPPPTRDDARVLSRHDAPAPSRHDALAPSGAVGGSGLDLITLASTPDLALTTRHGAVNLRRDLPGVGAFDEVARSAASTTAPGVPVPVLELTALCRVRRAAGSRKDIQRLLLLETVLAVPALEARYRDATPARARWTGA